jgi:hypothetical protein
MKRLVFAPLFLLACVLNAQGQEEEVATEREDASQAEQRTPETPPTDSDQQTRTSDTFIPSEAISEDLSVSFPVDI